jgi:hypothetical protein
MSSSKPTSVPFSFLTSPKIIRQSTVASSALNPPILFHVLIAGSLITMILLVRYAYEFYALTSQEDHQVEWATVVFYAAAAAIGLTFALKHKRVFDGLVALFCLFNGGEEFSWGQRLLGFSPPKYFLEANVQQEVSIHNFFGPSVHNLLFSLIVVGYFVLLPLLQNYDRSRKLMDKVGATAPPLAFAPWALLVSAIYIKYPIHLSSEWMETILAGLFLAASAVLGGKVLSSKKILMSVAISFVATMVLTHVSSAQERVGTPERVACAQAEVRNLLDDILRGDARTDKFKLIISLTHRRVYINESRGYLKADGFVSFRATQCTGVAVKDSELRHRYAIDPWGLSYWLLVKPQPDGSRIVTVYSFGPDRRRNSDEGTNATGTSGDDDISATGILPAPPDANNEPPVFSLEH